MGCGRRRSKTSIKRPAFQSNGSYHCFELGEEDETQEAEIRYRDLVRHLKRMRDETMQGIWINSAIMHSPIPKRSKLRKCDPFKR